MQLIFFLIFSLLVFSPTAVFSQQTDDFNFRDDYMVTETDHFKIIYPKRASKVVGDAISITEDVFDTINYIFGYTPASRTVLVIEDEDVSGGWAIASINAIAFWATAMEFLFRGTHNWMRDVIAHEYAHVVSIRPSYKFAPSLTDIRLGYMSSLNNQNNFSLGTVAIPLSNMPMWFLEGLAQYVSKLVGGDRYDSHRQMMLRADAINGTFLTLDEMRVFSKDARDSERVYNHGFSFVQYISDNYGIESIREIINESSELLNFSFDASVERVLGIPIQELYNNWTGQLKKEAFALIDTMNSFEGITISEPGFYVVHPKIVGNKVFYKSSLQTEFGPLSYMVSNLDSLKYDSLKMDFRKHNELVIPAVNLSFDIAVDSSFYVISRMGKRGSPFRNLYIARRDYDLRDTTVLRFKKEEILSKKSRIIDVDISNNNTLIAFTRNRIGHKSVGVMDTTGKVIFETDTIGGRNAHIFNPYFCESDSLVIFSYFVENSRNIGILDFKNKITSVLIKNSSHDQRDAKIWNNKVIYSADYSGIFNIYAKDLETNLKHRITNVQTGAFMPFVNDSVLVYSQYGHRGYVIKVIRNWQERLLEVFNEDYDSIKISEISQPQSEPLNLMRYKTYQYSPLPDRYIFSPLIMSDFFGHQRTLKVGMTGFFFDPLMQLSAGFYGAVNLLNILDEGTDFDIGFHLESRLLPFTTVFNFDYTRIDDKIHFQRESDGEWDVDSVNYIVRQFGLNNRYQINNNHKIHLFGQLAINGARHYTESDNFSFRYDYYQGVAGGVMLSRFSPIPTSDFNIDPKGLFFRVRLAGNYDRLMRASDNVWDVFFVTPHGTLRPRNDKYIYPSLCFLLHYYMPMPKFHFLTAGIKMSASTRFNAELDSFFYTPNSGFVGVQAYPLKSDDLLSWRYSGTNNFYFRPVVRAPLISNIGRAVSLIYFDRLYATFFGEYGFSSSGTFTFYDLRTKSLRGVGASVRLETIFGASYPWLVELKTAMPWRGGLRYDELKVYLEASLSLDGLGAIESPF